MPCSSRVISEMLAEIHTMENFNFLRSKIHSQIIEFSVVITVKTLNIGTPRPATVVVLNIKQFNFTMK